MDELNKLWTEISEKTGRDLPDVPESGNRFPPTASNMLATIRQRTRWKLYFIVFFMAIYLFGFFWWAQNAESCAIFGVMLLFGALNLWLVLRPYLKMRQSDALMSCSSKEVLQSYHDQLESMLRQENLLGALFTPLAAMLGFMLPFVENDGTAARIFSDWRLLGIMCGFAILVTPLGAWSTRRMNKAAFGKYLQYLKETLQQLNER